MKTSIAFIQSEDLESTCIFLVEDQFKAIDKRIFLFMLSLDYSIYYQMYT